MDKQLSRLMLISNLCSTLFYAMSYPYIYAETLKVVSKPYITFEQVLSCLGAIIFGILWNKHGNRLFRHYKFILLAEMVADAALFTHVLITGDLKFYFVLNVIIFATVTKSLCCGGIKMRALVHPNEHNREQYDNNANTVNSIATLLGATTSVMFNFNLTTLFVFALIGNTIDNFFYLYIYNKIKEKC